MLPVAALAACFAKGELTLGGSCALEDPASVVPARAVASVAKPGSTVEIQLEGERPAGFSSTTEIEVKQGKLGTVDCTAPEGWLGAEEAAALAAADAGLVDVAASPDATPSASRGHRPRGVGRPGGEPGGRPRRWLGRGRPQHLPVCGRMR